MVSKHHLEPRRTFHFTLALYPKLTTNTTRNFPAVTWKIMCTNWLKRLHRERDGYKATHNTCTCSTWRWWSREGIYIIIFSDIFFSIEIMEILISSSEWLAWETWYLLWYCYTFDGVFTFILILSRHHQLHILMEIPSSLNKFFCVIDNILYNRTSANRRLWESL